MTAEARQPEGNAAPGESRVPMLVMLGLFVILAGMFWPYTCDDSYITFRYVQHLAQGLGPVFNPGEVVEGYSNLLWVGLLWLGVKLGADVVPLAKVLGLVFGLGALLFAVGIARRLTGAREDRLPWLALVLAPNAGLAYFAVSGMETVPYACLLTGAVYCFLLESRAALWSAAVLGLAAALMRPEGLLVMLALLGWRLLTLRQLAPERRRVALAAGAVSLLGLGLFFLARHAVFGAWLPNTYYAKPPGAFGTTSYLSAFGYLRGYLADNGAGVLLALVVALLLQGDRRMRRGLGAAVLVLAVEVALVLHARGDWMALYRFLVPVTPLLVAGGFAGLLRLTPVRVPVLATAVVLAAVSFVGLLESRTAFRDGYYPQAVMGGQSQQAAGEWLKRIFPANTVLACKRIGGISYYSGMRMVDELGLVDKRIAHLRHTSGQVDEAQYGAMAEEILSRRPDLILLCVMQRWAQVPLQHSPPDIGSNLRDVDNALYARLMQRGYIFLCRYPQANAGELAIYRRADFPTPLDLGLPTTP